MTEEPQFDEWTPEALANFEAAQARLIHALDQFSAGARAAMATRAEGPELVTLRAHVDRALVGLDQSSAEFTGEYFETIDHDLGDEDEFDLTDDGREEVDPEEGAGLGVAVLWRFDLRVERPSVLSTRARELYAEHYPEMSDVEVEVHTSSVGAALQAISELAGLDTLMGTDGLTPLGGIRAFIATEDLLDGADSIDALMDPERDTPMPWDREVGAIFLPADGEVGITEGFEFV